MNFEMRRENHAIGEFSATIELFSEISNEAFLNTKKIASNIAKELGLPVPVKQQGFQFSVGPEMSAKPVSVEAIGYQKFAPDGEVDTLFLCEQNKLTVTLHSYVSWIETKKLLKSIFEPLLDSYLDDVPAIKNVSLQYVNEFRSLSPHPTKADEMFRPESKWIPEFCRNSEQNWHTHGGIFKPNGDSRFLINVNLDMRTIESPELDFPVSALNNLILIRLGYDVPGKPPLVLEVENRWEVLENNLDQVHTLEKDTLFEIYSDEYLQSIGTLNAKST